MAQVGGHPFFASVKDWEKLREIPAPFVPALDSEIDTGYYDDFTSAEDMAKYAEVKEKQKNVEAVREKEQDFGRGVWVGFTFGKNGLGPAAANAMYAKGLGAGDDSNAFVTIF